MELNVTELDEQSTFNYQEYEYEKIPENMTQIKNKQTNKKSVHFNATQTPMHQPMQKTNAKFVRQHMHKNIDTQNTQNKISYESILSKMGMFVSDGKLHLIDRNKLTTEQEKTLSGSYSEPEKEQLNSNNFTAPISNYNQHNYIYNKYFKNNEPNEIKIRKPKTLHEYQMMVVDDYIEKYKIKQMKSTKLIMPTSNIQLANANTTNLNKLFMFSTR